MTQPSVTIKNRQRALFRKTAAYLPALDAQLRAEKEAEKTAHRLAAIRIETERQPRIEARCKRLIENLKKENQMARQITTEKGLTTLSISADQKAKLIKLADKYAVGSMSAFVGAIADGKYRIMSEDACELVDKLLSNRAARKERYEAKKQKEEDNANH